MEGPCDMVPQGKTTKQIQDVGYSAIPSGVSLQQTSDTIFKNSGRDGMARGCSAIKKGQNKSNVQGLP